MVTGGSGFIGQRVLATLASRGFDAVTVLGRRPGDLTTLPFWRPAWECRSSSLDAGGFTGVDFADATVLHLAAATGKASPADLQRVNVDGTSHLLRAAREGGTRHFVLVSSIAAGYADRRWYPYAESKREAEAAAQAGGVPCTIVRPTMVFGPGSAVQTGLTKLSTLPRPVVFGSGDVATQPVAVDDVATCLVELGVMAGTGEVIEVGGADVMPMNELMSVLRRASGRSAAAMVHLPVAPIRALLGMIEPVLRPVLPLTAGQLAAFVNDSTARPSATLRRILPAPHGVARMVSGSRVAA